ncbi:MAG: hypothetical protein AAGB11_05470 [Pseudomonadota bacterium]
MRRITIALAFVALATPGLADCDDFVLTSDGQERSLLSDVGEAPAVGDRLFGHRAVLLDGQRVGSNRFISTAMEAPGDGGTQHLTGAFLLDDGTIHYEGFWNRSLPATDVSAPGGDGYTAAITGGTGRYNEATGTITNHIDGLNSRYSFDIDCD